MLRFRVPSEAAKGIKVGEGQSVRQPSWHRGLRSGHRLSRRAAEESFAGDDLADGCRFVSGAHVEIEHLLPHGGEDRPVTLLAGVFLRDLQFHGLVGVGEAAEERRDRLADLKIDGAVFDLDEERCRRICRPGGWKLS